MKFHAFLVIRMKYYFRVSRRKKNLQLRIIRKTLKTYELQCLRNGNGYTQILYLEFITRMYYSGIRVFLIFTRQYNTNKPNYTHSILVKKVCTYA